MNTPAWRVWLTVFLVCGWGIALIRSLTQQQWPIALMCAALFVVNAFTLWQMTRRGR